jgi:hypothetical protein
LHVPGIDRAAGVAAVGKPLVWQDLAPVAAYNRGAVSGLGARMTAFEKSPRPEREPAQRSIEPAARQPHEAEIVGPVHEEARLWRRW